MDTKITVDSWRVLREVTASLDLAEHTNEIILMIERLLGKLDDNFYQELQDTIGFPVQDPTNGLHQVMMACHWLVLVLNASNIDDENVTWTNVDFINYNGRFNIND
jgi:hypothetical protein